MSELTRDLLMLAGLVAPVLGYAVGRVIEHRIWVGQRTALYESLGRVARTLNETQIAERQALDIVRAQRDLLRTMTAAAEQLGDTPGPISEARHRLAWAAAKARAELL